MGAADRPAFLNPHILAALAVQALIAEVRVTPKPALVDQRGSGAHDDLTLDLMEASAHSLHDTFARMGEAAVKHRTVGQTLREEIGAIGREGEAQMLRVTRGVNTHKGAVWTLGLLVTAAALGRAGGVPEVCLRAGRLACIEDRFVPFQASHGQTVRQRYGAGGAKAQAQAGFPAIWRAGYPQLFRSRCRVDENTARVDALLAIMAGLEDTCVLYRSGRAGLRRVQQGASAVLAAGGMGCEAGRKRFDTWERGLLALRASAGGAADLLAGVLFVDSLLHREGGEFVPPVCGLSGEAV
ncbi:triphosphoribosyl-dephospho-CoA synthase [Neisseria leonii]|uniref:Probable 2-(5''-triphosphoribosyl)-3'-dephosphocoenzyme-A synthase n=1 Tax=Neisseria leonii TaxID=2995413 RepID=A0A9X4IBS0_9NEIS|nr:triphosphoribosyl-dephospho-CoA synthase [Neisseria sp. 51.81]MDD9328705.1 triphosphoribosyl-dephospho-CoA synthase [Neisseria sp. 51.81]